MPGIFLKRLALLLPVFLGMSGVIFLIIHLVPGDPLDHIVQIGTSPERKAELAARYGFDRPLAVQYLVWLGRVAGGDLGDSIILRQPVTRLIAMNLPHSLALGGFALAFSTLVGVAAGALAALRKGSAFDRLLMAGILLGSTLPSFWMGLMMILIFAAGLGWFPVSGAKGWDSLVLPVLTIGLGGIALFARVTRAAMLETASRDFVVMLHAKGLSRRRIHFAHVLRHALLPVVTVLGLKIGWILGGAVTIEFVFARPGLGTLLINALNQRDYPVVQGCLLMLGIAVMLGTLIADLLQMAMDPRIRQAGH